MRTGDGKKVVKGRSASRESAGWLTEGVHYLEPILVLEYEVKVRWPTGLRRKLA